MENVFVENTIWPSQKQFCEYHMTFIKNVENIMWYLYRLHVQNLAFIKNELSTVFIGE